MIVEVWEVYSGDYCVGFTSKELAKKQIMLSPVDEITKAEVNISEEENNELNKQGYIWL